jgi:probable HAF family extracellular repeat protein
VISRAPLRSRLVAAAAVALAATVTAAPAAAADYRTDTDPTSFAPVFVMQGDRIRVFDPPGPVPPGFTGPVSQDVLEINNRGQIVGGYKEDLADPDSAGFRGFLRDAGGRVTLIDVPGAAGTSPFDVNDRGQIVGTYSDTDSNTGRAQDKRGFLRDAHGRYTTIRVPGSVQTQAFGINDRGEVVGEFQDRSGDFHGFRLRNGRFSILDVPGSAAMSALDINDRGWIVGAYLTNRGELRGFLLSNGDYRRFDAPGRFDLAHGINNRGQIVVATTNGSLESVRSYVLRSGVGGPFTRIRVPGSPRTYATGIDDGGRIVGLYERPTSGPIDQRAMPLADALPVDLGREVP